MRPPIGYYGAKVTIAPRIVALFPEHDFYVEPYAGSLAVLLAKPPSTAEVVNDLDGDLVPFWRVLRERPEELLRLAALTPHARAEYEGCKALDVEDDLERARRVWVLLTQGRSRTLVSRGWRRFLAPSYVSLPRQVDAYVDRIAPAAERLRSVSLECRPALEVIAEYDRPGTLLYVDPPYLRETRASLEYRFEAGDEQHHRDLAKALHDCEGTVVLSGYPSPLYEELFGDWHRHEITTKNTQGAHEDRLELVLSNHPFHEGRLFR